MLQVQLLLDQRWNVWAIAADPLAVALLDHVDGGVPHMPRDPVQRHHAQGKHLADEGVAAPGRDSRHSSPFQRKYTRTVLPRTSTPFAILGPLLPM